MDLPHRLDVAVRRRARLPPAYHRPSRGRGARSDSRSMRSCGVRTRGVRGTVRLSERFGPRPYRRRRCAHALARQSTRQNCRMRRHAATGSPRSHVRIRPLGICVMQTGMPSCASRLTGTGRIPRGLPAPRRGRRRRRKSRGTVGHQRATQSSARGSERFVSFETQRERRAPRSARRATSHDGCIPAGRVEFSAGREPGATAMRVKRGRRAVRRRHG